MTFSHYDICIDFHISILPQRFEGFERHADGLFVQKGLAIDTGRATSHVSDR